MNMVGRLVMMHGYTGNPKLIEPLTATLTPPNWKRVCPKAPHKHPERGWEWWAVGTPTEKLRPSQISDVENSIRHLEDRLAGDDPLIVGGFSQGGSMAIELLHSSLEQRIQGIIVLSGRCIRPELLLDRLREIAVRPFYWAHGNKDKIVPLANTLRAQDMFIEMGWKITKGEHSGGHMIPRSVRAALPDVVRSMV